jgi:biotin carboxylase
MPEHVLVVGGGMEMPSLLRRLSAGVRTSVACQLAIIPKLRDQTGHERVLGLRADAPDSVWIEAVQSVHRADPITRVASFGERDQDRAAAIAAALGLPMHSPQTVEWVHHKPSMRERLALAGVDDTPFALARSEEELRSFVRTHGFPCIAKPATGAGSIGIRRIDKEADVSPAFETAGQETEWTGRGVLVERLHEGPQFSVEAFSESGEHVVVCITKKYSDPRGYVEVGHLSPAPLPETARRSIAGYTRQVLDALDIRFGPTHTEIVLTDQGPRVIETHIRLGGDRIPYLVRGALGVDLVEYTVRQVLGQPGLLGEVRKTLAGRSMDGRRYDAVWFATTDAASTLESVSGVDRVRAWEQVEDVEVHCAPGSRLESLSSSDSRLGYVHAYAATPEEALRWARSGVEAIEFRTLPHEPCAVPESRARG